MKLVKYLKVYLYNLIILHLYFQLQKYGRNQNHQNMSISSASSESASIFSKSKATGGTVETTNESAMNSLHQKSLANKMRGIGKKISRFRSRSAERVSQRSRNSPDRQEATDDNGLSKPDIVPLQYPSRRQDRTSGTHTVITFRYIFVTFKIFKIPNKK